MSWSQHFQVLGQPISKDQKMDRVKENSENDERLLYYEEYFKEMLSPLEPTIMKLQSLLVWEKPVKSTVMIASVHCIFWWVVWYRPSATKFLGISEQNKALKTLTLIPYFPTFQGNFTIKVPATINLELIKNTPFLPLGKWFASVAISTQA